MQIKEIFEETKKEKILQESIIPITPFLAFASFKKNTFGRLKDNLIDLGSKVGNFSKRTKATVRIEREKLRAGLGLTTGKGEGATVYKLNKEQMDVMSDIYRKYGKVIVKDILLFRKNVLAPYSLIKRKIKESSRVTNKEKFGMTKAEFKTYLESGRKKIEGRGEKFSEKSKELRDRISRINDQIDELESAKEIIKTKEEIPKSILSRLYTKYQVHDRDLEGYSASELRSQFNELNKSIEDKIQDIKDGKSVSSASVKNFVEKNIGKEGDGKKGNFNIALGRYMFRRDILDQLRDEKPNPFKDSYFLIINEMNDALIEQKKDIVRKLRSLNSSTELNDKEKKIWKKRATSSEFSNDLNDYYQAIREEDFLDAPIYLERTPELKEAEQQIENEIRRFERSLQKKISPEDFNKLKNLRVINNLISVRELVSPGELFKNADELVNTGNADRKDLESSTFLNPDEFEKSLRRFYSMTFSSISEMNKHKALVEKMIQQLKKQGDDGVVQRLSAIIERFRIRRTLTPQQDIAAPTFKEQYIDINDIQNKAEEIINKRYESSYDMKYDKQRLDDMIEKFKLSNEDSEKELRSISFLIDRVETKLSRGI